MDRLQKSTSCIPLMHKRHPPHLHFSICSLITELLTYKDSSNEDLHCLKPALALLPTFFQTFTMLLCRKFIIYISLEKGSKWKSTASKLSKVQSIFWKSKLFKGTTEEESSEFKMPNAMLSKAEKKEDCSFPHRPNVQYSLIYFMCTILFLFNQPLASFSSCC